MSWSFIKLRYSKKAKLIWKNLLNFVLWNFSHLCPFHNLLYMYIKFIYSEKATKFCEISTVDLSYVVTVKSTMEISQNFVAFSEYMNFNWLELLWVQTGDWQLQKTQKIRPLQGPVGKPSSYIVYVLRGRCRLFFFTNSLSLILLKNERIRLIEKKSAPVGKPSS